MALPTWVNNGTQATTASATSLAPAALPGSRVNNNLLFAFIGIKATGKSPSVGGGWTVGDTINTGTETGCWAWRLVDGTEAVPTFSWSGAAAATTQIMQFSGNAVSPIGVKNKNAANSSTTETIASLTSSADNSLIIGVMTASTSQTIPTPTNWTQRAVLANANTSYEVVVGSALKSGSATDAISVTIASANWASFGIEILGSGTGIDNTRASQTAVQALETYSDATETRASQVVQQVLETYSDATEVRASQIVLQVLRGADASASPQDLLPGLVTNTNTFYGPVIAITQVLLPGLLTNTNTFFSPTIYGHAFLYPGRLNNVQSFFPPTLAIEGFLFPGVLTNTNVFFSPSLLPDIRPALFVNTNTFFGPTIGPGPAHLYPLLMVNSLHYFLPAIGAVEPPLEPGREFKGHRDYNKSFLPIFYKLR